MKIPLILTGFTYSLYIIAIYYTGETVISLLVFLLPVILLVSGLILRKKLKYNYFFLSRLNFLTDSKKEIYTSDISSDLLFEKLLQVILDADFKLLDTDENNLIILASTAANFLTWGENICIRILPDGEQAVIELTSYTIFGSYSWKRNEHNTENFYNAFEASLII